jgi:hypothetical protein
VSLFPKDALEQVTALLGVIEGVAHMAALVVPVEHEVPDPRPERVRRHRSGRQREPERLKPVREPTGAYIVKFYDGGSFRYGSVGEAEQAHHALMAAIQPLVRTAIEPVLKRIRSIVESMQYGPEQTGDLVRQLGQANALGLVVTQTAVHPSGSGFIRIEGEDAHDRAQRLALNLNQVLQPTRETLGRELQQQLLELVTRL